MSIWYDLPRGQFFDEEDRYVNPATVAEKLVQAEAENAHLRNERNANVDDAASRITALEAECEKLNRLLADERQAERDVVLREAIRYFYGNHNICDDEPCDACENWVRDFPRMVAASLKEGGE